MTRSSLFFQPQIRPPVRRERKKATLPVVGVLGAASKRGAKERYERKHTSSAGRSWIRPAIGLLVMVELILLGGHAVRWFASSPRFILREVEVVGHRIIDPGELVKMAGLAPGTNLFEVDLEDVRRRVEVNPWVRRSSIRQLPPSTIRIEIEERQPAAVVGRRETLAVDTEGVVLGKIDSRPSKCLPHLKGFTERTVHRGEHISGKNFAMALRAASLFEMSPLSPGGCLSVEQMEDGRLRISAQEGELSLEVGEEKLEVQAARFRSVARWLLEDRKRIPGPVVMDLTFPGRIIVRPLKRDGGAKG